MAINGMSSKIYRIAGISPLLMHRSETFMDPTHELNKQFKKLSGKRSKTEEDYAQMSRLEFLMGIYIDGNSRPVIPADNLQALIVEGARKHKLGKQASAGAFVDHDAPLIYEGPRTAEELFADPEFVDRRGVVVQRNRVMRTRPIFRSWAVEFEVSFMPQVMEEGQIDQAIEQAGLLVGLGDFRPRFGRFIMEDK